MSQQVLEQPTKQQDAPRKDAPPAEPLTGQAKAWRFFHHHVKPILIVAVVLTSVRSSIADWNDVPTGSMKPSILEGDRIFVNKLAYDLKVPFTTWHLAEWGNPSRGEVVVFYNPKNGVRMVKRVVGIPGDVVEMRDNQLILNGNGAQYSSLSMDVISQIPAAQWPLLKFGTETTADGVSHPVMGIRQGSNAKRTFAAETVPAGKYFLMGDNRDDSADSREWGFADRDQIVGRAVGVAVSLDPQRSYRPRWDRFFRKLP